MTQQDAKVPNTTAERTVLSRPMEQKPKVESEMSKAARKAVAPTEVIDALEAEKGLIGFCQLIKDVLGTAMNSAALEGIHFDADGFREISPVQGGGLNVSGAMMIGSREASFHIIFDGNEREDASPGAKIYRKNEREITVLLFVENIPVNWCHLWRRKSDGVLVRTVMRDVPRLPVDVVIEQPVEMGRLAGLLRGVRNLLTVKKSPTELPEFHSARKPELKEITAENVIPATDFFRARGDQAKAVGAQTGGRSLLLTNPVRE